MVKITSIVNVIKCSIYTHGTVCKIVNSSGVFKPLIWDHVVFNYMGGQMSPPMSLTPQKVNHNSFLDNFFLKKLSAFYDIV